MHKIENVNGWNGREWRADLPSTCGFENRPLVCPHRAIEVIGKNCLSWVKTWNGIFGLYIRKIPNYGFLAYSFKNCIINWTNAMSCFPNAIGPRLLKVVIHSYRIGVWSFIFIFASIPNLP